MMSVCTEWEARTAIDWLSIIWRSDLSDKIKLDFFLAAVVLILLYGCTTWTLRKALRKGLMGTAKKILQAIVNKFWKANPSKQQLYGYLSPISKTNQVRRKRQVGHCWRNKDEIISDVLPGTSSLGRYSVGRLARTYHNSSVRTQDVVFKTREVPVV